MMDFPAAAAAETKNPTVAYVYDDGNKPAYYEQMTPDYFVKLTQDYPERSLLFSHNDLSYVRFSNFDLSEYTFSGCFLRGAQFLNCNLKGTGFHGSNLTKAKFVSCQFSKETSLAACNLTDAFFRLCSDELHDCHVPLTIGDDNIIKTVRGLGRYHVNFTKTKVTVGCQSYRVDEWLSFDSSQIDMMDTHAYSYYKEYKKVIEHLHQVFFPNQYLTTGE